MLNRSVIKWKMVFWKLTGEKSDQIFKIYSYINVNKVKFNFSISGQVFLSI